MEKNEFGLPLRTDGETRQATENGNAGTPERRTQDNPGQNGTCIRGDDSRRQLAMVYSPEQPFCLLYTPGEALAHGTLFEELDKPLGTGGNGR